MQHTDPHTRPRPERSALQPIVIRHIITASRLVGRTVLRYCCIMGQTVTSCDPTPPLVGATLMAGIDTLILHAPVIDMQMFFSMCRGDVDRSVTKPKPRCDKCITGRIQFQLLICLFFFFFLPSSCRQPSIIDFRSSCSGVCVCVCLGGAQTCMCLCVRARVNACGSMRFLSSG